MDDHQTAAERAISGPQIVSGQECEKIYKDVRIVVREELTLRPASNKGSAVLRPPLIINAFCVDCLDAAAEELGMKNRW
jgi:hypothetical protein